MTGTISNEMYGERVLMGEETCETHSPYYILSGMEKKKHKRVSRAWKIDFDRVRDRWFQTLSSFCYR